MGYDFIQQDQAKAGMENVINERWINAKKNRTVSCNAKYSVY